MHIILGILGSIVTILFYLSMISRSGVNFGWIGWLNPFAWQRRRAWRQIHQTDPIYKITSPMEATACLMYAMARCSGDVTREQKTVMLESFRQEFHLSERDAADMLAACNLETFGRSEDATARVVGYETDGVISRIDGIILLAALAAFIYWQIGMANGGRPPDFHEEIGTAPHDNGRIALFIVGGIVGLPLGAQLTIIGATDIARSFGISETAVGLTVVALGTSLPELATGIMAAYRGSSAVAIGNVVGSNIFNIACIMGITSVLIPVAVDPHIISTDTSDLPSRCIEWSTGPISWTSSW